MGACWSGGLWERARRTVSVCVCVCVCSSGLVTHLPCIPRKTRTSTNTQPALDNERRHRRHLPARRRRQLLPLRQRCVVIAAPCLCCRPLHARAGSCSAAEPAGSPLHRPPAHRQRRRTAPVLPLLGARRPAKVSGEIERQTKTKRKCACVSVPLRAACVTRSPQPEECCFKIVLV